jgi:hypothetical protein
MSRNRFRRRFSRKVSARAVTMGKMGHELGIVSKVVIVKAEVKNGERG